MMGYGNSWGLPFGGTNIDFVGNNLNIYYKYRTMNLNFTNGVISDSSGNLLFNTNGIFVADSAGNQMPNGDSLNPGLFSSNHSYGMPIQQGNIIIPKPGDAKNIIFFMKHVLIWVELQIHKSYFVVLLI